MSKDDKNNKEKKRKKKKQKKKRKKKKQKKKRKKKKQKKKRKKKKQEKKRKKKKQEKKRKKKKQKKKRKKKQKKKRKKKQKKKRKKKKQKKKRKKKQKNGGDSSFDKKKIAIGFLLLFVLGGSYYLFAPGEQQSTSVNAIQFVPAEAEGLVFVNSDFINSDVNNRIGQEIAGVNSSNAIQSSGSFESFEGFDIDNFEKMLMFFQVPENTTSPDAAQNYGFVVKGSWDNDDVINRVTSSNKTEVLEEGQNYGYNMYRVSDNGSEEEYYIYNVESYILVASSQDVVERSINAMRGDNSGVRSSLRNEYDRISGREVGMVLTIDENLESMASGFGANLQNVNLTVATLSYDTDSDNQTASVDVNLRTDSEESSETLYTTINTLMQTLSSRSDASELIEDIEVNSDGQTVLISITKPADEIISNIQNQTSPSVNGGGTIGNGNNTIDEDNNGGGTIGNGDDTTDEDNNGGGTASGNAQLTYTGQSLIVVSSSGFDSIEILDSSGSTYYTITSPSPGDSISVRGLPDGENFRVVGNADGEERILEEYTR